MGLIPYPKPRHLDGQRKGCLAVIGEDTHLTQSQLPSLPDDQKPRQLPKQIQHANSDQDSELRPILLLGKTTRGYHEKGVVHLGDLRYQTHPKRRVRPPGSFLESVVHLDGFPPLVTTGTMAPLSSIRPSTFVLHRRITTAISLVPMVPAAEGDAATAYTSTSTDATSEPYVLTTTANFWRHLAPHSCSILPPQQLILPEWEQTVEQCPIRTWAYSPLASATPSGKPLSVPSLGGPPRHHPSTYSTLYTAAHQCCSRGCTTRVCRLLSHPHH